MITPTLTEGQIISPLNITDRSMYGELDASAAFLNMSPQKFLADIGLSKAYTDNNNNNNMPGVASKPHALRGFLEPVFDTAATKGVRERYRPISYNILREIERKNPIVSASINVREKDMRNYAQESKGDDIPGYRIVTRDPEHKPTKHEKEQCKDLMRWFRFTGRTDFLGWEERKDRLLDVMKKMIRDYMSIDQVPVELRRDKGGKIVDFWVLDGATIFRTVQTGYRGTKQDFDPRSYVILDSVLEKKLLAEKKSLIPDIKNIRYVQQLEGRFVAAYTYKDMILDSLQKRTDVRYYAYGYPPLEQAMNACTAFLFGMAYNAEAFNSGTLPKIALAFKDGNFSPEQLMALQDEFIANFRGIHGAWRIPMFNRQVDAIDLYKSARDMEYMKYLEFMASLIFAILGVDSIEVGLRFQQAQNVLAENQGSRLSFAKDRAMSHLLGGIEDVWNNILLLADTKLAERYKFEYTGVIQKDKEKDRKIKTEEVKTVKKINELRAEEDLPPDKYGDIILDPIYLQNKQAMEMSEQQEQAGGEELAGGTENIFDEVADEVTDEMFKARKVIDKRKIRTLLIN